MNFVLYDEDLHWKNFLPLTFTKPLSEIRIGILTIREKWNKMLQAECSQYSQAYLSEKFLFNKATDTIFIVSNSIPDTDLCNAILNLQSGEALWQNQHVLAWRGNPEDHQKISQLKRVNYVKEVFRLFHIWDVFQKNAEALRLDFDLLCKGRASRILSSSVTVIGDKQLVFLEEGAKAEACILNTSNGPVYLAADAEIMEGSIVRGPLALGEHSCLKLGTRVYGATTIGPHCKVGGEVNNSVIIGYSNKAHDGFLGNSVIGEWCNLGADTNNSNLKNNYGTVKLHSYLHNKAVDTGLQFCGMIMGDHSKSGINTMFNTGTVVGIGSNIYGGGFPATYIPNFSWGGSEGFVPYHLEKLFETASRMYERRGLIFSEKDQAILKAVKSYYS